MALIAGAKLATHRVNRPQQALNFYQAAQESKVPHLDLEPNIQFGMQEARMAIAAATAK
jgi:hypothetical protein